MTTGLSVALGFVLAGIAGYLLEKYVRRPLMHNMKDGKLKRILLKRIN